MTIFVIDDDEAVRDSLALLLESYGMQVEGYGSVEAFMRHYEPRQRACLILDHHLPGMSGVDFLASPAASDLDLPVILLTAQDDPAVRARAVQSGISAYLPKPVEDGMLVGAIAAAMRGAAEASG